MLAESIYLSMFLMGLLGGTHCVGMCGGIVSALTMGLPREKREHSNSLTLYLLLYNFGRISSYFIAGLVFASMGSLLEKVGNAMIVRQIFTILAAILMIFLGLYLAGWSKTVINKIEQTGSLLWKGIQPLARKFIPIRTPGQALIAGLLWGWLPCGLVYTALIWAISAESILQGGLIMASFGIGTLPTLIGIGFFSATLIRYVQKQWVRSLAGIIVAGFGVFQLVDLQLFG